MSERRYVGLKSDPEHRKWIGKDWDLLGAYQLCFLIQMGLREHHTLLDIGCGSFRGGRFLMMYLQRGHYCGIEPKEWLVDAGIKFEVSQGLIDLKEPRIYLNGESDLSWFGGKFDYVLAHSILFHAPLNWIEKCFREVKKVLKPEGVFLANVKFSSRDADGVEWNYPTGRCYRRETLERVIEEAGLKMELLETPHIHSHAQKWIRVVHT